jgi:hypothetical protein
MSANVIAFPLRGAPAPPTAAPRAHRDIKPATSPVVTDDERQAAAAEIDQVLGYAGAGARALERWGRPAESREARGLCRRCRMHRVLAAGGRCEPCSPYDEERG